MGGKTFYIKLSLLVIPVLLLACVPFIGRGSGSSIGGGGYDLTDLVYGIYILLAIVAWVFFMIIHSLIFRKNAVIVKENSRLLIIGIVVFILACLILFNTWIK